MNWRPRKYARIRCHQRHFYWLVSRSQQQSHSEMVNPRFLILLEFCRSLSTAINLSHGATLFPSKTWLNKCLLTNQISLQPAEPLGTVQCLLLAAFHVCQNYTRPIASASMDADWAGHSLTQLTQNDSDFHVFKSSDLKPQQSKTADEQHIFFFTLWWYTWHILHSLFVF